MASMKPDTIRYRHIENMEEGERLDVMGINKFGEKFLGFVKETTFVHSDGFMTKKIEPFEGSPAKEFRRSIESAGLLGVEF